MRIQFYPFMKMALLIAAMVCLYAPHSSAQQTYASSQANGVTGICLLCGVVNPNNPVNNTSLDDHSTFNIGAALGVVTVHQTLTFPSVSSNSCDSLVIGIGAPMNPGSNPYGAVTVQTLNGSAPNNDGRVVDDAILRQVQGYGRAEIVLKPRHAFDRVKLTLNVNGLGLATSFRVYYAYRKPAMVAPLVAVPQAPVCGPQTFTVNNHAPGLDYVVHATYTGAGQAAVLDTVFRVSGSGQIAMPPSGSPSDVQADVTIRAENADGSCRSDSIRFSYTAGGSGMLPTVDIDQVTACQGAQVTLHAYTADPDIPFIHWYDAPVGGNLLYTGDHFTVTADANVTYYVTSQAQCEFPQRKAVKIITSPRPPMPELMTPDTIYMPRFSGVTLTANGVSGSTIHWYRSDTAAVPISTGNSYTFTALSTGTLFFYAGAELNGCESVRKRVMVVVHLGNPPSMTSNELIQPDPAARMMAPAKAAPTIQALRVYPNPTSGEVRFTADKDLSGSVAVIRDVNGREVQREILQRNGLNISRLPADGIYFIQVITRGQEVFTGKVLLHK